MGVQMSGCGYVCNLFTLVGLNVVNRIGLKIGVVWGLQVSSPGAGEAISQGGPVVLLAPSKLEVVLLAPSKLEATRIHFAHSKIAV